MQKSNIFFILKSFVIWRITLIIVAILAIKYLPVFSLNFFGGKYINYVTNPLLWCWANFDGEHYISIAMYGYKDLQLAFFPGYPIVVNLFANLFGSGIKTYLLSGIIISNVFFLASLFLLWKIIILDYSEKTAKIAIILLLIFPTSFYFGSVYTESFFLFLSLLTYYLYRNQKYLLVGLIGIILTLTRLYGVFVILMIGLDILINNFSVIKVVKDKIYLVGLSIIGILSYMWFSWVNKGDALAFYSLQTNVGEQRSEHIILLPQVFYRYMVRILPNLKWNYFPVVFSTQLELMVAVLFLVLIVYSFKKLRWDYWLYILLGFMVPTMTGSFSSLARYVIVLFPAFIFLANKLENINKYLRLGIYLTIAIIAIVAQVLFVRGYWVA